METTEDTDDFEYLQSLMLCRDNEGTDYSVLQGTEIIYHTLQQNTNDQ